MAGMGYVAIAIAFGFAGGIIGRMKGSAFWVWFLISGLVPVFGLLAAIFYRWEDRELRRQCPRGRDARAGRLELRHAKFLPSRGRKSAWAAV